MKQGRIKAMGSRFLVACAVGVLLGGCGQKQQETVILHPSDAVELDFSSVSSAKEGALEVDFSMDSSGRDEESGLGWWISPLLRERDGVFWQKSYARDQAQYGERFEIYRLDSDSGETRLLYTAPDATFWMNELAASDGYLYWVEYQSPANEQEESSVMYQVIQYELASGGTTILAERSDAIYDEICLEAGIDYVTWYDSVWEDGDTAGCHKAVVYDVHEGSFVKMEADHLRKFAAYERLNLTENGITFFTEEDGEIFVNRVSLKSGQSVRIGIGKESDYPRLAGCFSTEDYIGWNTDYSSGTYYLYDLESGAFRCLKGGQGVEIFSKICDGPYFILNDRQGNRVIRCRVDTGQAEFYAIPPEDFGMHFRQQSAGEIDLRVEGEGRISLVTIP